MRKGVIRMKAGQPLQFRKSSYSQYTPNACVEVANSDNVVVIRDSKNCSGPRLEFSQAEWDAFIKGVKNGEFDSP